MNDFRQYVLVGGMPQSFPAYLDQKTLQHPMKPKEMRISPIEVKSSNYRSHTSLDKFRKRFSSRIGTPYNLYAKDIMIKDDIWHLPLYMAIFL